MYVYVFIVAMYVCLCPNNAKSHSSHTSTMVCNTAVSTFHFIKAKQCQHYHPALCQTKCLIHISTFCTSLTAACNNLSCLQKIITMRILIFISFQRYMKTPLYVILHTHLHIDDAACTYKYMELFCIEYQPK